MTVRRNRTDISLETESRNHWREMKCKGMAARQAEEIRHAQAIHAAFDDVNSEAADAESRRHEIEISGIEEEIWIADSYILLAELDEVSIDRPSKVNNADWWEEKVDAEGLPHKVLSGFGRAAAKHAIKEKREKLDQRNSIKIQELSAARATSIAKLSLWVAIISAILAPILSTILNSYWPTAVEIKSSPVLEIPVQDPPPSQTVSSDL